MLSRTALLLSFALVASGCDGGDSGEVAPALATNALESAFSVTYIGDSHSDYEGNAPGSFGYLGYHLVELMAAKQVPLSLYAASGSSPTWWFDDTTNEAATWGYSQNVTAPSRKTCHRGSRTGTCVPKLAALTAARPSLFVIEQGTNLLGRSASDITNQVKKTLRLLDGHVGKCLWVAAPNARTSVHSQASQDQLYQLIHDNAGPACTVYDSRFLPRVDAAGRPVLDAHGDLVMDVLLPYSPDANNDGEHFGKQAAGKWAEGVAVMIDHLRGL